ncbi:hypothetical protein BGZ61DRAFT_306762, partial [Ilyonectria robusta]|uniref:uncharacterized protein n=1 Tax=Ilyonectria robusta TaxID=1079257 RepID=UPI001E8CA2FA
LRADRALAAFVENPQRLDHARGRFSESPPSYRSHLSHNSTRSQSPNPPSEEQKRRGERKWQLIREHRASFPSNQFDAEKSEEIDRLYEANRNRSRRQPAGTNIYKLAEENVKTRWVEQGIWNERWKQLTLWRWKHEEPFEPESESVSDSAAEGEAPLFCLPSKRAEAKPRRPKSAEELRWIAGRRPVREREREASRPFHRFVYQVSKERERIQDEMNPPAPPAPDFSDLNLAATTQTPLDINSTAYERVKNTWMERGIWNKKWGVLPGMSWKHEQPLEEMLREELGDDAASVQASALGDDRYGTGEVPPRSIFGAPLSAESNGQASGIRNASQQEPPADTLSELLNGDVSHSSTASNSRRRHATSREAPRSGPQQRRRFEGGQAPLGPVHWTKVSKARGKNGPGPRRLPNASELPSEAQQSLPGLDVPAPPPKVAPVPPRRSKRLQVAERKTAADPSGIAATDPHVGGSQLRPRRISARPKPARLAKPQRVSKRRPSTTRR